MLKLGIICNETGTGVVIDSSDVLEENAERGLKFLKRFIHMIEGEIDRGKLEGHEPTWSYVDTRLKEIASWNKGVAS